MKHFPHISGIRLRAMISTIVAGITLSTACTSDMSEPSTPYEPGQPAHIRLSWSLPEMNPATRTLTEEDEPTVNNLWIGIYDYTSGKLKSQQFIEPKDDTPGHHVLQPTDILDVKTVSGQSRIVAVANADTNYGFSDDTSLCPVKGKIVRLDELLAKADTWQKYLSICVARTDATSVDLISRDMVMSGIYYGTMDHPADMDWTAADGGVYIPAGDTELDGALHLRRIDAKVRFEIVAGAGVEIEMTSWQVINNPIFCNLHEQRFNAGDRTTYFIDNRDDTDSNYSESRLSQIFENSDGGGYEFTFYQYENKRRGLEKTALADGDWYGVESYADREREYKNADGSNTGIYKSLSPVNAAARPNADGSGTKNFATYVTFRLKVTYWVGKTIGDAADPENDPDAFTPVPKDTPDAVRREGYADYTVHLGYIEGGNATEKAEDFNCRRNMKYTYNVTVKSLSNIIVEAFGNAEKQPGAEGDVTDVQDVNRMELDAHYAVFNIRLSNRERRNLKWMIEAPYDNVTHSYYADDYREGGTQQGHDLDEDQFYTWVRFKPTTAEGLLRRYRDYTDEPEENIWTLEQLAHPETYRGVNGSGAAVTDVDSEEQLWYTVFIDEYVYHKDANGNSTYIDDPARGKVEGSWHAYVNQAPRTVWIACNNRQISADRESMYMNSKYMISQNSILTYYSAATNTPNKTALGIERETENFGLNLAWSQTAWNALSAPNADNGRWNVWHYLTNGKIDATQSDRGWSEMAETKSVTINGETRTCLIPFSRQAIDSPQLKEPSGTKTAPIFMPAEITTALRGADSRRAYNPDPDGPNYEVITACMSRNRDENGNGVIDADEMKWYVPTTGKYVRIILGRAVIPQSQRLMNFDETPYYGFKHGGTYNTIDSDNNTRHHFASSDRKVMWAEEGTSSSDWLQGDWDMGAWQIRCVRNLGVNMGRVIDNDPVTSAYEYDTNNRVFSLSYYEDACKRAPQSNHLLSHDVQSATNQPAAQFEVARNNCSATNTALQGGALTFTGDVLNKSSYTTDRWKAACDNNYICGGYSQETDGSDRGSWRVPNQKELVMMRREGILTGTDNEDGWLSCTQEHFDAYKNGNGTTLTRRFFVFYPNRGTINDKDVPRYRVRCVRDKMNN